jgi:hypothetical protein
VGVGDATDDLGAVDGRRLVVDDDAVGRLDRPAVDPVGVRVGVGGRHRYFYLHLGVDTDVARPQCRDDRPGSPPVRGDEEHAAGHAVHIGVVPNNAGESVRPAPGHGISWSPSSS